MAVRFGSLVHDLECYVDNSLLRDEAGTIVGRRGGVKAWLQVNIPALYVRYTTVMRYKAMAKKLRQVVGLADPVPAEAVLAPRAEATRTPHAEAARAEQPNGGGEGKQDYGAYEIKVVAADGAETRCRVGGQLRAYQSDEGDKQRSSYRLEVEL